MSASRCRVVAAGFVLAGLVGLTATARADDFSVRAGAYTEAEAAFVGVEYRTPVTGRLQAAPNLEVAFPSDGSLFSFNGDLHYVFPQHGKLTTWLGGGLGIYIRDPEGPGHDTNVGANFIGGLGVRGNLEPYLQLKVAVFGDTEVVLGFGLRF
jgi:hypothetical protein